MTSLDEATTEPAIDHVQLAAHLRMALVPLVRQLRQHNVDLTASQASALGSIWRDGPLTVGELAEIEHVSSPMITKVAKGLEEMGLVSRTTDPGDRRVCRLTVTKEGERRLDQNRKRKTAWLARRLRMLDPDDLKALEAALPVIERITERPER